MKKSDQESSSDEKKQRKQQVEEKVSETSSLSTIPEAWKKILDIATEATLPHTLPVQWEKTTEGKHKRIAFDPSKNAVYDLEEMRFVKRKGHPVRFIELTIEEEDEDAMSGKHAAVRFERYNEGELNKNLMRDGSGEWYLPCIAHGDYVKVESLQADHFTAKSKIQERQIDLVKKLNDEPAFANFLMQHDGMDKFFIKVEDKYFGTLFFYELYFNDIDNIWLICQACNHDKSNRDTLEWLSAQWLYGSEFLDYLQKQSVSQRAILEKTQSKQGLAEVAIGWFWERHATYVSVVKDFSEKIKKPIQILGQKIDRVVGQGSQQRAQRLKADLDFKMQLASSIIENKKLRIPQHPSEEIYLSSEDDYPMLSSEDEPFTKSELPSITEHVVQIMSPQLTNLTYQVYKKLTRKRGRENEADREEVERPVVKISELSSLSSSSFFVLDSSKPLQKSSSEDTLKEKLFSRIPNNFQLGRAATAGDCFFDSIAQVVNQRIHTVKSLRLTCEKYARGEHHTWVKQLIEADHQNFETYLSGIVFTGEEIENGNQELLGIAAAVWGRPEIEGRILSGKLGIHLHIIEVLASSIDGVQIMEQIIDSEGSCSIDHLKEEDYNNPDFVHLVVHQNHFVPLINTKLNPIRKSIKLDTNKILKTEFDDSTDEIKRTKL